MSLHIYQFGIAEEFAYLGTLLNANNDIKTEAERTINNEDRAYFALIP